MALVKIFCLHNISDRIVCMSTQQKTAKKGRPKLAHPASERLVIRVTPDQLSAYKDASDAVGKPLSAWARDSLDKASSRRAAKKG